MIESSFIYPSSWDSELFRDPDDIPSLSEFEDCVANIETDSLKLSSCCTTPNDLSCSSSDYEGLILDDLQNFFPEADSFISQILEESNSVPEADSFISQILEESNSIGFDESNWSSLLETSENCDIPIDDASVPVQSSSRKSKKRQRHVSTKSWSKMSPDEQLKTLHALSEIVTCHMGIGEQIEVIKIIDPAVTISPDDTEFALDSSSLNDAKMKRIQDFVHKHGFSLASSQRLNSSSTHTFTSEKSVSRKSTSRTKRRQKKQKIHADKDSRQKRKLELHGQKEAQSGLFVYEKVIKLSNPMEDDEDVNILE